MRRKSKRHRARKPFTWCLMFVLIIILLPLLIINFRVVEALLKTNCLASVPACECSWRNGKFVADCGSQNLSQVPQNDYLEFLIENSGANKQMSTLDRDIQVLNLSANLIVRLEVGEFYELKKFRNLQKLFLAKNKLESVPMGAFHKLTNLVELDLSENEIVEFELSTLKEDEQVQEQNKHNKNNNKQKNNNNKQSLKQLRHLNLNANLLTRLERNAFSPLVSLRQLYLSKNKIHFIDKRAFDGLNVLNVLHLDGNELVHLDSQLVLKLPALFSLQLAANRWLCDCHLRKLVRLLLHKSTTATTSEPRSSLDSSGPTTTTTILQDEPHCKATTTQSRGLSSSLAAHAADEPRESMATNDNDSSGRRDATHSEQSHGRPWTNMTLAQFECRPQLASADYLLAGGQIKRLTGDQQEQEVNERKLDDKQYKQVHQMSGNKPLALTCAIELEDELDIEFTQIDWFHVKKTRRRLLWSSVATLRSDQQQQNQEDDEFALIDYVTRANETTTQTPADQLDGSKKRWKLIRIVHLILSNAATAADRPHQQHEMPPEVYVCRITNTAGRLELETQVQVGVAGGIGQRRQVAERNKLLASKLTDSPSWSSSSSVALIANELTKLHDDDDELVFVPIHLAPGNLFATLQTTNWNPRSRTGATNSTARGSRTRDSDQMANLRPSTTLRQTTSAASGLRIVQTQRQSDEQLPSTPPPSPAPLQPEVGDDKRAQLRDSTLELVSRFTSNQRSLITSNDDDDDDDDQEQRGHMRDLTWDSGIPGKVSNSENDYNYNYNGDIANESSSSSFMDIIDSAWRQQPNNSSSLVAVARALKFHYLDKSWRRVRQLFGGGQLVILMLLSFLVILCLISWLILMQLHCARKQGAGRRRRQQQQARRRRGRAISDSSGDTRDNELHKSTRTSSGDDDEHDGDDEGASDDNHQVNASKDSQQPQLEDSSPTPPPPPPLDFVVHKRPAYNQMASLPRQFNGQQQQHQSTSSSSPSCYATTRRPYTTLARGSQVTKSSGNSRQVTGNEQQRLVQASRRTVTWLMSNGADYTGELQFISPPTSQTLQTPHFATFSELSASTLTNEEIDDDDDNNNNVDDVQYCPLQLVPANFSLIEVAPPPSSSFLPMPSIDLEQCSIPQVNYLSGRQQQVDKQQQVRQQQPNCWPVANCWSNSEMDENSTTTTSGRSRSQTHSLAVPMTELRQDPASAWLVAYESKFSGQ